MEDQSTYTAFVDETLLCSGPIETILPTLKARFDHNPSDLLLTFEDATGKPDDPIYPFDLAVERVKAAVEAADADRPTGRVDICHAERWLPRID